MSQIEIFEKNFLKNIHFYWLIQLKVTLLNDFETKLFVKFTKISVNQPKCRPGVIIVQFFFNYFLAAINKIPNFGWKSENTLKQRILLVNNLKHSLFSIMLYGPYNMGHITWAIYKDKPSISSNNHDFEIWKNRRMLVSRNLLAGSTKKIKFQYTAYDCCFKALLDLS